MPFSAIPVSGGMHLSASLATDLSDQRTVHPVPKSGARTAFRDGWLPGLIHRTRHDLKHRASHAATAYTYKELSQRTHMCPTCGVVLGRDHNAAVTIRSKGVALLAQATVGHHGKSRLGRGEPLHTMGDCGVQARSLNQESQVLWPWECQIVEIVKVAGLKL
jgi:hypothetical protein